MVSPVTLIIVLLMQCALSVIHIIEAGGGVVFEFCIWSLHTAVANCKRVARNRNDKTIVA